MSQKIDDELNMARPTIIDASDNSQRNLGVTPINTV